MGGLVEGSDDGSCPARPNPPSSSRSCCADLRPPARPSFRDFGGPRASEGDSEREPTEKGRARVSVALGRPPSLLSSAMTTPEPLRYVAHVCRGCTAAGRWCDVELLASRSPRSAARPSLPSRVIADLILTRLPRLRQNSAPWRRRPGARPLVEARPELAGRQGLCRPWQRRHRELGQGRECCRPLRQGLWRHPRVG